MVKLHASPVLPPSISVLLHWNHPFFIVKSRIFIILDDVYLQLFIPNEYHRNLDGNIPATPATQLQNHLVPALATFVAARALRLIFVATSVASRPRRKNDMSMGWNPWFHGFTQHIQHRKKKKNANEQLQICWMTTKVVDYNNLPHGNSSNGLMRFHGKNSWLPPPKKSKSV